MFSVTERIRQVNQPRGGYVPLKKFIEKNYIDDKIVQDLDLSVYESIQGMAVDYLTRLMLGIPKHIIFEVALKGAEKVNQLEKAEKLFSKISGLDTDSIISVCYLVCYDADFRKNEGFHFFPMGIATNEAMINNIAIMVERSLLFFKKNGSVIRSGFTFPGAYNDVISSGDGDFLTKDTLWDFKAIKKRPDKNHTLQILVYYIMGIHSSYPEFKDIKKIGIYNPKLNTSYEIYLSDIADDVFQAVSKNVIGYCTPSDSKFWREAYGTSESIKVEIENIIANQRVETAFDPEKYEDGIYDITANDYWSFCRSRTGGFRPKYSDVVAIKFIKNSGYKMFVAITKKGELRLLNKGSRRVLDKSLQYYFEKLPEYSNAVLSIFSKYWEELYRISKVMHSVVFDEKELMNYLSQKKCMHLFSEYYVDGLSKFTGRVHGCIVDIDFRNHIYVDPISGSLTFYHSLSKDDKRLIYDDIRSLIAKHRPGMFLAFMRVLSVGKDSLCLTKKSIDLVKMSGDIIKAIESKENFDDEYMYKKSRIMGQLQSIYDEKLINVWYDEFLYLKNT